MREKQNPNPPIGHDAQLAEDVAAIKEKVDFVYDAVLRIEAALGLGKKSTNTTIIHASNNNDRLNKRKTNNNTRAKDSHQTDGSSTESDVDDKLARKKGNKKELEDEKDGKEEDEHDENGAEAGDEGDDKEEDEKDEDDNEDEGDGGDEGEEPVTRKQPSRKNKYHNIPPSTRTLRSRGTPDIATAIHEPTKRKRSRSEPSTPLPSASSTSEPESPPLPTNPSTSTSNPNSNSTPSTSTSSTKRGTRSTSPSRKYAFSSTRLRADVLVKAPPFEDPPDTKRGKKQKVEVPTAKESIQSQSQSQSQPQLQPPPQSQSQSSQPPSVPPSPQAPQPTQTPQTPQNPQPQTSQTSQVPQALQPQVPQASPVPPVPPVPPAPPASQPEPSSKPPKSFSKPVLEFTPTRKLKNSGTSDILLLSSPTLSPSSESTPTVSKTVRTSSARQADVFSSPYKPNESGPIRHRRKVLFSSEAVPSNTSTKTTLNSNDSNSSDTLKSPTSTNASNNATNKETLPPSTTNKVEEQDQPPQEGPAKVTSPDTRPRTYNLRESKKPNKFTPEFKNSKPVDISEEKDKEQDSDKDKPDTPRQNNNKNKRSVPKPIEPEPDTSPKSDDDYTDTTDTEPPKKKRGRKKGTKISKEKKDESNNEAEKPSRVSSRRASTSASPSTSLPVSPSVISSSNITTSPSSISNEVETRPIRTFSRRVSGSPSATLPPPNISIPKLTPPASPSSSSGIPPVFAIPTSPHYRSPRAPRSPVSPSLDLSSSHLPSFPSGSLVFSPTISSKSGYKSPPRPRSPSPLHSPPSLSLSSSIPSPTNTSSPRSPRSPSHKSSIDFLVVNNEEKKIHTEYLFRQISPTFNGFVEEEDQITRKYLPAKSEIESVNLASQERLFCDCCNTSIPDRHWAFDKKKATDPATRAEGIAVLTALEWYRMANAEARLSLGVQQQVIETCHRCKNKRQHSVVCSCLRKFCYGCLERTNFTPVQAQKKGWRCAVCLELLYLLDVMNTCDCAKCKQERVAQSELSTDDFYFDLCLPCGDDWTSKSDVITMVKADPKLINSKTNNNNNDKNNDSNSVDKSTKKVNKVAITPKQVMEFMSLKRIIPHHTFVNTIAKVTKLLATNELNKPIKDIDESHKRPLGLNKFDDATLDWFQQQWRLGLPVVITECRGLKLQWSPQDFMDKCGVETYPMIDCRDGNMVDQLTVANFFEGYIYTDRRAADNSGQKMKLKLKDWPASEDFSTKLPEHFSDLMEALPFTEYIRPSGSLNMISMLPSTVNKPDLGPKCYIAYEDTCTMLHFDMSDAVNLLVHVGSTSIVTIPPSQASTLIDHNNNNNDYASPKSMPSLTAGALWHIFRREDVPALSKFLKTHRKKQSAAEGTLEKTTQDKSVEKEDHSILDHSIYVTDEMLEQLKTESGVVPHIIYQELGDSVFIPAGCPHQVKNVRCCIKVAEDFVSPENLEHCVELTNQFRKLPPLHKFRKDRLQVKTILYHAVEHAVNELIP